jgi:hypothetical protein
MDAPVAILLRAFVQTLVLAAVFAGAGHFLLRTSAPAFFTGGAALRVAMAYFAGLTLFLPAFLLLSRGIGARAALLLALVIVAAALAREVWRHRATIRSRTAAPLGVWLLALVAFFALVDISLWLERNPFIETEPGLLTHYGSIHSGRYANYAIYIVDHDVVPRLAQNGGQSMLAAANMLLGLDSPLAALMAWLPVSLAFLALLVFGLLREGAASHWPALAGAALVMLGNTALSQVHVLVFDNGNPPGFVGYTDMVVAIATFLIFARWLTLRRERLSVRELAVPLLLGLTWAWYAPQNVVIAAAVVVGVAVVWTYRRVDGRGNLVKAVVAMAVGMAIGATQFGPFLPKAAREDVGYWTQEAPAAVALRPYVQYLRGHWTGSHWNTADPTRSYGEALMDGKRYGADEIYRNFAWTLEDQLWDALRVFGFPILGLALAFTRGGPPRDWAWLSFFAFATGFAIYFCLELGGMKWWVSRFLVPGTVMAMTCLAFVVRDGVAATTHARWIWIALAAAALWGPIVELGATGYRNFVLAAELDPIGKRIARLASEKGPFLFDGLAYDKAVARRDVRGLVVGRSGQQGVALWSEAIPLVPGRYSVGFRMLAPEPEVKPVLRVETQVLDAQGRMLARRAFAFDDLEHRADGEWAVLSFESAGPVRFRFATLSEAVFVVTDMRVQPR